MTKKAKNDQSSKSKNIEYSYGYAKSINRKFKKMEEVFDKRLEKDKYYIIRFDGKSMTKRYKIKHCAINEPFFETMKKSFIDFCKRNKQVIFGYSFSDEVSVLIRVETDDENANRIEKILSLWASTMSVLFYKNAIENRLELKDISIFDARIIEIEKNEIANYFIARQAYAIDKYLMQLKAEYHIDYKINKSREMIEKLKEKAINYYELPEEYRYGLLFSKEAQQPFEFSKNLDLINKLIFD